VSLRGIRVAVRAGWKFELPSGPLIVYDKSGSSILFVYGMSKRKPTKKMGRPPKAEGAAIVVPARLPPPIAAAVDEYALSHAITRSEAVRRLIEAGLKRRPKA
jgi:hypothetical protein